MNSSPDLNKKLFGNCKVEWRIDKFSLQTFPKKWLIQSPDFSVNGYEETKWSMNLRSKHINGINVALFSLKRSSSDSGPKYIQLNVKICFKKSEAKSICYKDKVLSLKNGSKFEVCFGLIESLFSKMYRSDDLLVIVCHMIAYSASTKFVECTHSGLKLLSKNMLDLYRSAQNYDTKVIIDDNCILSHKAILCARNEYLSSIIEEDDDNNEDDNNIYEEIDALSIVKFTVVDGLDYKAMRKVLAYLYTGDIRHALEEPSFAVHHCASFLGINEIETLYEPDRLILQSTVDFEEYLYSMSGYEFENSSFSWHCDTKESTKTYRLIFYPKRDNSKDYIPLFTKVFEASMLARLEFYFLNQLVHLCTVCLINDGDVFIDTDKIANGITRKLSSSLNLFDVNEMKINLKMSSSIKLSYVKEDSNISVSCINEDIYYEGLSADLEYLLDGGPFQDTVIDNNGTFFWVHKCILASRSRLFSDMLMRIEEGEAIVVSNIDSHIVSLILTYIYSGYLSDVIDDVDVMKVYKAAVMADFPQLKSMCSELLKLSSKTNRNIICRTLRIAEKYGDESLMKSVLKHLFERQYIDLLSINLHPFQDVNSCRHCLSDL